MQDLMPGLVDIHAHLLPAIDDGPADLPQALALADAATSAGITTLVATPHLRDDFPDVDVYEIAERCEEVRDALRRAEIPLTVITGAEVSLSWALDAPDGALELASYGQRGRDLLIETPTAPTAGFAELLHQIRLRGYRVTLAHPERSVSFQRDPEQLPPLVDQGVLLQVNAASLRTDRRGSPLERLARHLCESGLAHAVASDGHRASAWRPVTELGAAFRTVREFGGPAAARRLMIEGPEAILAGRSLPDPPVRPPRAAAAAPKPARRRSRFWR